MKACINYICCCLCCRRKKRKTQQNATEQGEQLINKSSSNNNKEQSQQPDTTNTSSNNNSQTQNTINQSSQPELVIPPFDQQFTKEFVLQLTAMEFNDNVNYTQFYSKNNMTFHMRKNGSIYSTEFPTIRMNYSMKKSEFPPNTTIKDLCIYMNSPAIRRTWDKAMKDYQIISGNEEVYILQTVMNSPVAIISDRDMIMKRIDFFDGNDFYFFSRSTANENVPLIPNMIRMDTIYNAYKIEDKGDMFHFQSLAQMDFKMNVPQFVFNLTMPMTLNKWYNDLKTKMNKDYESKKGGE